MAKLTKAHLLHHCALHRDHVYIILEVAETALDYKPAMQDKAHGSVSYAVPE